jgi:hypothetical protein
MKQSVAYFHGTMRQLEEMKKEHLEAKREQHASTHR